MRAILKYILPLLLLATSCRVEDEIIPSKTQGVLYPDQPVGNIKGFYLLNEGNMGNNKCTLDYFDYEKKLYISNIYAERNPGVVKELGDVGNDIQVYGDRLYCVVNCSNIVEVMDVATAKHIGVVSIPNCRYITFKDNYAYVSSYAGPVQIDPNARLGYVAKVDLNTLEVVAECTVGYQPEELVVVGDRLYVANSGGYRAPNYDNTISVIDLKTFTETKQIEVAINLHRMELDRYGYLWISSRGDSYDVPSRTYLLDTRNDEVVNMFELPNSNMTRSGDSLYVLSTEWSWYSESMEASYALIDLKSQQVVSRNFIKDNTDKSIVKPYGLAVNPESGEIFITDAKDYITPGKVHCYTPDGRLKWSATTGDIPAHIVFTTGDGGVAEESFTLSKGDFTISHSEGEPINVLLRSAFEVDIASGVDPGVKLAYDWKWDGATIATTKDLTYTPTTIGTHVLSVAITDFETTITFDFEVRVDAGANLMYLTGSHEASLNRPFRVMADGESGGATYRWFLDGGATPVSTTAEFAHTFTVEGRHKLRLEIAAGGESKEYEYAVNVVAPSAYVTSVFDYRPAPGQFVNLMPAATAGDTQTSMNLKVLDNLKANNQYIVALGSYGGYVTVGFNQTIENRVGLCDFRVLGNAFYSAVGNLQGGSCEPGIIMVSRDVNGNGVPDDEWYEIAGSSHVDHTKEGWYNKAVSCGNDVNFYFRDFQITYAKPIGDEDISWTDNKGNSGHVARNGYNTQSYYPVWIDEPEMTFRGSRLPQNMVDDSGDGTYFVLYKLLYGYCDNGSDLDDTSAIDISWAVDADRRPANLDGVDFVKIYCGVNQGSPLLGETSTEVRGVVNLHAEGAQIESTVKCEMAVDGALVKG